MGRGADLFLWLYCNTVRNSAFFQFNFIFLKQHTCAVPLKITRICGFNFTRNHVAILIPSTAPILEHKLSKAGLPSGVNANRTVVEKKNLCLCFFVFVFKIYK